MLYEEIRRAVADTARGMDLRGLAYRTAGNVSARTGDGRFAVTPTALDHTALRPQDITVIDCEGSVVEGEHPPTTEVPMHLAVYGARPDVAAIVHTHSAMATTLAVLGEDLPAIHYVLARAGSRIRCARYATFGSSELAANALEALGTQNATLLANHGVLAVGRTLDQALAVAEAVEVVAGLYVRARSIGSPRVLDEAEMTRVADAIAGHDRPPAAPE